MYHGKSLLAVIPARGGSKGLPRKNVLDCAGRPLIAWTIEAARRAASVDVVLVSTDSEEVAEASREAGADVPFVRPDALASDAASMLDVISHSWENHRTRSGTPYDYVIVLQPTSPLRGAGLISDAITHYFHTRRSDQDTLASVIEAKGKYGWLLDRRPESPYVRFCFDVSTNPQRQQLPDYYLPNGAIFIVKGTTIAKGLYRDTTLPFVMSEDDSIDIDSAEDLQVAAAALLRRKGFHPSRRTV